MSYEIEFLRRAPGQSWQEALDHDEEPGPGPAADVGEDLRAAWARIVPAARLLLAGAGVTEGPSVLCLDHRPTGVQLSVSAGTAGITVPCALRGPAACDLVEHTLRPLARIVERETGLEAWDPQLAAPVTEGRSSDRPRVAAWFAGGGEATPTP